jgi:outer membrane lipoprotein carrier protein
VKRRAFAALAALALSVPLVAGSSAAQAPLTPIGGPSADEIIGRVQAFYDKTKTFKSTFKQQYKINAYGKMREDTGVVTFQKPGRMSWRYPSNGNRIVSDGTLLKIYEKDSRRMLVQPLGSGAQYTAALSFLLGQGQLKQNFKLTKQDAKLLKYPSGYVLEGIPLQPNPAAERVLFYIDAQTSQVRRVILIDAQGNRNRFDFVTSEVNTKPPKGEFAFTPPPGTQVIRP